MSIQIEWDDEEKSIIRYTFLPGWTIEEFHRLYNKPSEMLRETGSEFIGVLIDDSRDSMPPRKAILAFSRTVREGRSPIVIMGVSAAARVLLDAARKGYKSARPLFYADTLEQGRRILQAYAEQSEDDSEDTEI